MSLKLDENKDQTFQDFMLFIENELGKTEWVTVFEFFSKKYPSVDNGTFYCALIPCALREKYLEKGDRHSLAQVCSCIACRMRTVTVSHFTYPTSSKQVDAKVHGKIIFAILPS